MSFEGARPGAAWLSSARVVRCSVQSGNERNPCEVLYMSLQTALSFEREAFSELASKASLASLAIQKLKKLTQLKAIS